MVLNMPIQKAKSSPCPYFQYFLCKKLQIWRPTQRWTKKKGFVENYRKNFFTSKKFVNEKCYLLSIQAWARPQWWWPRVRRPPWRRSLAKRNVAGGAARRGKSQKTDRDVVTNLRADCTVAMWRISVTVPFPERHTIITVAIVTTTTTAFRLKPRRHHRQGLLQRNCRPTPSLGEYFGHFFVKVSYSAQLNLSGPWENKVHYSSTWYWNFTKPNLT